MPAELSVPCYVEIEFSLKPGKRREFNRSFEDFQGHEGEGHVKTTVYEDREEPGHMIWITSWSNRASAERYIRSNGFGVLIGGMRVLGTVSGCRLISEAGPRAIVRSVITSRADEDKVFDAINLDVPEGPAN